MDYNLFGTGYVVVGSHEQTILRDFLEDIEETISSLRKGEEREEVLTDVDLTNDPILSTGYLPFLTIKIT